MNLTDGITVGSIATYSCSDGSELNENNTRVCQADRRWSGEAPLCGSKLHDREWYLQPENDFNIKDSVAYYRSDSLMQ